MGPRIFEFFHIFGGLITHHFLLIISCILMIKLCLYLITSVYFQTSYCIILYFYIFSTINWRIPPTAVSQLVLFHPGLIYFYILEHYQTKFKSNGDIIAHFSQSTQYKTYQSNVDLSKPNFQLSLKQDLISLITPSFMGINFPHN